MIPFRFPLLSICAVLVAMRTAAQEPISESQLMVIAQSCSIDGATSVPSANASTVLFTESDFTVLPPDAWTPTPGLPDFSTILGGLSLDIDALSVGFDVIRATPSGIATPPPGGWAALTFSVTRGTIGTPGGRIAAEVPTAGGAAGDVFVYVIPGSSLPPQVVDRTMRNQDSREMNIDAPGSPANIDAHDVYTSLVFEQNPQLLPLLPFVSVFFSVTGASVASVPAAWWAGTPPSGATVFRRDWLGSFWSLPIPYLTPADLGLSPMEDVDAVAIDVLAGHVLFSTTRPSATPGAPLRDPVLFHGMGSPGNTVFLTSSLVPISTRLGLDGPGGIDDVDGICALDPGPGGALQNLGSLIGTPFQSLVPTLPNAMGASVSRRNSPLGPQFVSYATGWPHPGTPSPSTIVLLVAPVSPFGPYVLVHAATRPNPSSPYAVFQGHPEQVVLTIPNDPNLLGMDVFFQWASFDATGLDLALPVGIRI
ncbi:MAG: hypothetical protein U1F36_19295 [Planctomycetota bacterium]